MMERTETSEWGKDPTRQRSHFQPYVAGTKKMLYVAGAYRDPRGEYFVMENVRRARDVFLDLIRMGYSVVCPHTQSYQCGGALPDDAAWLDVDREIIARCDGVVFLPGWRQSEGSRCEREFAEAHDIRCFEWDSKVQREFLEMAGRESRTFEELMEDNHA